MPPELLGCSASPVNVEHWAVQGKNGDEPGIVQGQDVKTSAAVVQARFLSCFPLIGGTPRK